MEILGNEIIMSYLKTGFLASSHIDVSDVMACYEWASRKPEPGCCVMSGFSSKMERDVLHFLLRAHTPVIWVLARRPYKELPHDLQEAMDENRLLIISSTEAQRQTKNSAYKRNEYIAETADKLLFTGVNEDSSLYPLYKKYIKKTVRLKDVNV